MLLLIQRAEQPEVNLIRSGIVVAISKCVRTADFHELVLDIKTRIREGFELLRGLGALFYRQRS